ncbi:syntaxin-4-like, partial [Cygnus olor]|uniref:syntaxin-4-like n=1 Tax=Cygnus olor TaxID=8869 RepID=UPI001ADDFACE
MRAGPSPSAMRDRTRELHQDDAPSDDEDERVALVGGPQPPDPPGTDTLLQARAVRAALRVLEEKLGALEQQQEAVLGTPLPDDGLKRDLQALREEIQQLTRDIGARLKGLEPGKEEEDENRNTIGARVKRTQHGVLSQQFLELTGRCHAAQARYRQRSLERVRRQLQISGCPPRDPPPQKKNNIGGGGSPKIPGGFWGGGGK